MNQTQLDTVTGPSRKMRWLVSILVIAHFFAVGTAVTSFSSFNFPAPTLAVLANEPVRPYLQFTFLNNAYRFFSPNPGTPTVLWFRVQHEDRTVHWLELPERANPVFRGAYQRRLNLTTQLGQHVQPKPGADGQLQLTDTGQVCIASMARHVANGSEKPVKSVGVYIVQHAVLLPEQIRAGHAQTDLVTYKAVFAGAFSADGRRVDEFRPELVQKPISQVAAGILAVDFYPVIKQALPSDRDKLVEQLGLPTPIRCLLAKHDRLWEPPAVAGELASRIESLLSESKASATVTRGR